LLAHWQGLPAAQCLALNFDYAAVTTVALSADSSVVIRVNR
jgi:hypothetical protein